jgi:hypothetical protein
MKPRYLTMLDNSEKDALSDPSLTDDAEDTDTATVADNNDSDSEEGVEEKTEMTPEEASNVELGELEVTKMIERQNEKDAQEKQELENTKNGLMDAFEQYHSIVAICEQYANASKFGLSTESYHSFLTTRLGHFEHAEEGFKQVLGAAYAKVIEWLTKLLDLIKTKWRSLFNPVSQKVTASKKLNYDIITRRKNHEHELSEAMRESAVSLSHYVSDPTGIRDILTINGEFISKPVGILRDSDGKITHHEECSIPEAFLSVMDLIGTLDMFIGAECIKTFQSLTALLESDLVVADSEKYPVFNIRSDDVKLLLTGAYTTGHFRNILAPSTHSLCVNSDMLSDVAYVNIINNDMSFTGNIENIRVLGGWTSVLLAGEYGSAQSNLPYVTSDKIQEITASVNAMGEALANKSENMNRMIDRVEELKKSAKQGKEKNSGLDVSSDEFQYLQLILQAVTRLTINVDQIVGGTAAYVGKIQTAWFKYLKLVAEKEEQLIRSQQRKKFG